jgi:hypothetical protein
MTPKELSSEAPGQELSGKVKLAEWQARELRARLGVYDQGDKETQGWKEVHDQMRRQYK